MKALSDLASLLGHRPQPVTLSYGTAGFRGKADTLYEAVLRCGALAAARSHILSKPVAVMVTASHNPASDNGLKIVEPDGSMLASDWESLATLFVNEKDHPELILNEKVPIEQLARAAHAIVLLGRDTRDSSPALADLFAQGVHAVGGQILDLGIVTTPQLHFAVRSKNRDEPWETKDYYEILKKEYRKVVAKRKVLSPLVIDCANGVGANAIDAIKDILPGCVVINRPGDGPLNEKCGADYVQKKRLMPTVYTAGVEAGDGVWASLDGDADRLVLYRRNDFGVTLADGDRFATLIASFVSRHMVKTGVSGLSVAVGQTAYSNGAATEFLQRLSGVEVVVAKTGVKHLEKAVKNFDIGIYWEPNGHGTILFSDKAVAALENQRLQSETDHCENSSLSIMLAISKLANQAVGDGVADLLLILSVLACEGMTFESWLQMYDERCSSNSIVTVADKNVIVTEDFNRLVKEPSSLRDAVAKITNSPSCRGFVRPSGTEDVIRVYTEAPVGCQGKAKEMALHVSRAVYDFCGGVGQRP